MDNNFNPKIGDYVESHETHRFNEKISKLENCNSSFELSRMICKNGNDEEYETIDLKAVISKINEIIDYLNKE